MTFPVLYKRTKTGAIQRYLVEAENGQIVVTQGQVGGKSQNYLTTCHPMNVGRANETTATQQAESEAQSKWNKKVKAGYSVDPSGIVNVKLPMKVKKYQEQKDNVVFPCLVSPKLNGTNGIYRLEGAALRLYSRGGDEYPAIPHLEKHIRLLMSTLKCKELNGELYIHGEHLQDITGAVKKPKELSKRLEFHVFDIPDHPGTYRERAKLLLRANVNESRPVKVIAIAQMFNHDEIEDYMQTCINLDYEGIVIRNVTGLYKYNETSSDCFKYKIAMDAEFKVFNHTIDKYGHVVFACYNDASEDVLKSFKVKPKGTAESRLEMASNAKSYIGKWLKVEFETYSKSGTPLKPVGLMFRVCNDKGEPIE